MEEVNKKVSFAIGSFHELSGKEQELLRHAADVRTNAQAPYSRFYAGVAVLSDRNTIHVGCNVERCSWSQTTHAEQNAIDSMIAAHGPSKIKVLTVVAAPAHIKTIELPPHTITQRPSIEDLTWCCGHCLQIIWENCFGDPDVKIISLLPNGEVASARIGDVLPIRFGPENIGVRYQDYKKDVPHLHRTSTHSAID